MPEKKELQLMADEEPAEKTARDRVDELIQEIANIIEEQEGGTRVVTKYVLIYEVFDHEGDRYPIMTANRDAMCYESLGLINFARVKEEEHIAQQERRE